MGDAAARLRGADQLGHQVRVAAVAARVHPGVEQQVDPRQADLHAFDLEHHLDGDAVLLEIVIDVLCGGQTAIEQRAEIVEPMPKHLVVMRQPLLAQRRDGRVEPEKWRVLHAPGQA
ncbi:hypothetical protein D3C86_1405270 [compost metagenome]